MSRQPAAGGLRRRGRGRRPGEPRRPGGRLGTNDIAEKLCYSVRTVKNVVYALTSRLQLHNRAHAVAYALQAGIIRRSQAVPLPSAGRSAAAVPTGCQPDAVREAAPEFR